MTRSALAFRRGLLTAALESALASLRLAHRCVDLLDDGDRKLLTKVIEMVRGVEQRAWGKKP